MFGGDFTDHVPDLHAQCDGLPVVVGVSDQPVLAIQVREDLPELLLGQGDGRPLCHPTIVPKKIAFCWRH